MEETVPNRGDTTTTTSTTHSSRGLLSKSIIQLRRQFRNDPLIFKLFPVTGSGTDSSNNNSATTLSIPQNRQLADCINNNTTHHIIAIRANYDDLTTANTTTNATEVTSDSIIKVSTFRCKDKPEKNLEEMSNWCTRLLDGRVAWSRL